MSSGTSTASAAERRVLTRRGIDPGSTVSNGANAAVPRPLRQVTNQFLAKDGAARPAARMRGAIGAGPAREAEIRWKLPRFLPHGTPPVPAPAGCAHKDLSLAPGCRLRRRGGRTHFA